MATTSVSYTGNGSTTNYSFTFQYIKQSDIKASLDGTATTAFTFANATTLSFNTAPANGVAIKIFRETDDSSINATFFAGSAIKAEDLNDNFEQTLFISQESNNLATAASSDVATAVSDSATALSTANTASTNATNALNAVNNVVDVTTVANVASLPGSPSDLDRVEITDSTGATNGATFDGLPAGFTGASGLLLRVQYKTSNSKWNFIDYRSTDPDARYLNQDTTGNAATATALETARTIAGQSFNGTANITIAATDLSDTNQSLSTTDDVTFDVVTATSYTESVATAQTALDPANGGIQTFVTSSNTTFTDSLATGESMTLMVRRASASHTVTFPTTKWVGNVTPPVTTTSGKYSIISLWKVGSDLYGSYGGDA